MTGPSHFFLQWIRSMRAASPTDHVNTPTTKIIFTSTCYTKITASSLINEGGRGWGMVRWCVNLPPAPAPHHTSIRIRRQTTSKISNVVCDLEKNDSQSFIEELSGIEFNLFF